MNFASMFLYAIYADHFLYLHIVISLPNIAFDLSPFVHFKFMCAAMIYICHHYLLFVGQYWPPHILSFVFEVSILYLYRTWPVLMKCAEKKSEVSGSYVGSCGLF